MAVLDVQVAQPSTLLGSHGRTPVDLLVVALIAIAVYCVGWALGWRDRPAPPPWPEVEDCEPLSPLARRILPYLPLPDLPDMPRREPPDPLDGGPEPGR